jgi:hypothetical protein
MDRVHVIHLHMLYWTIKPPIVKHFFFFIKKIGQLKKQNLFSSEDPPVWLPLNQFSHPAQV